MFDRMFQPKTTIVRKHFAYLLIIILFLLPIYGMAQQPSSIQIYFFYSEECQPCQIILRSYLPTLKTMFPTLEVKTFDVGNPAYYEALTKLEKKFGRTGDELPIVFVGDQMLSGEMEVMEKLNLLLLEVQAKGGGSPPPIEIPAMAKPSPKSFTVDLAYFYQKGCPKCDRANALLKYMAKRYPQLHIKEIDLNTPDGKRLNETLSTRLNLPMEKRLIAPSIFIGNNYLSSSEITESKLETSIQKYGQAAPSAIRPTGSPAGGLSPTTEETKKAEESIIERFKSFGILAILIAGLVEGLNPCALATLVFFISYLTMVGRKRKEIFWVGMGFTGAGFVTHLLLGLGILGFIQHLSFLPLFSQIVYLITFVFSLFLGIFSLYDYVQLKRGRPSRMTLQVPDSLKKRIHRIIRTREGELEANKEGKSTRFLLSAMAIGFIITLLQSTCTSQVYLPTILFVTNIPSLRDSAISYLVFYNIVYILPLVAIFGIVYWGTTSEQLSFLLQRRTSTIKLLTALFFFALAGILLLSLI
jgi:cytochrome c biogenesis protein CcdA/thiol-disulfide isomerase/thioredoxin